MTDKFCEISNKEVRESMMGAAYFEIFFFLPMTSKV